MRTNFVTFALAASVVASPAFAMTAADVLAANKQASGGKAWDGKAALKIQYAYDGQGMTGSIVSVDDLGAGRWVDDAKIGPATQTQGFDGAHTWVRDQSGTVTQQDGGDSRLLAFNEGYRRANMWWRADVGGAGIVSDGTKTDGGASFDVLTVTPKGGKSFDAWFDGKTHLLARVVEQQGPQVATTTLSDYRLYDGVELPAKARISMGDAKYDQVQTIASATFEAMPADAVFAMPTNKVADFSIAGGAASTTLPFELINNHIYARVAVNGKPFTFIFDSGGVNVVTPPTAQALGLESVGHMQGNGGGSGHMDFGLTKVRALTIGQATIAEQVVPVAPLNDLAPAEGLTCDGMVGFETFRRFVTVVDYGARTLTFIDPAKFDAKGAGTPVPFEFYGNTLIVQASYAGHKGGFIVDTGARMSLTLNTPFVKANGLSAGSAKSVGGVTGWGIGGPTRSVVLRGAPLTLGAFTIEHPVAELSTDTAGSNSDAALAGNIGAGVLKRYVVTLDYPHQLIYLKPIAGPIADLDTFDRAGVWLNLDPSGFKVIDAMSGAPAEAAGLKAGDVVTAVDGRPAGSLKLYELRRRLRDDAPGTVVTFAVKGKGDVKVTLRDLI
ncbi:MAG: aspartyl protease family protein [Alphaproteobacteria bacterium]|nr:aspartyl protease family protein [Alphaproteobacteria bacterium]